MEEALIPAAKVQTIDSALLLLPVEIACKIALLCGPSGFRALAASCRHFRWMLNDLFMQASAMDCFARMHSAISIIQGLSDSFVVETPRLPSGVPHGRENWYIDGLLRGYRSYQAGQLSGPLETLFGTRYLSGLVECGRKIGIWEERGILNGHLMDLAAAPTTGNLYKRIDYRNPDDVVEQVYIGDKVYEQYHLVNGVKSGLFERFDTSGTFLLLQSTYADGELNGLYRSWSTKGVLIGECFYVNGQKHGYEQIWKRDGTLEYQCNYVNDRLHGEKRFYGPNGKLQKIQTWTSGKRNGPSLRFSLIDGSIIRRANYVHGLKQGMVQTWRESDGTLVREENYEDGLLHGDERHWDGSMLTRHMESWVRGVAHGHERYYQDGKLVMTRIWIDGAPIRLIVHDENYRIPSSALLRLCPANDPAWFSLPEP